MIDTGMTERPSMSISAPFGAEEMDALYRVSEAHNSYQHRSEFALLNSFARIYLRTKTSHKWVRIHADGRSWTDDIPEYGNVKEHGSPPP